MKPFANKPQATAPSGIREIVNQALLMEDVIRLEVGQPDFDTPAHILDATCTAMQSGFTRYTATAGFLSLRELLSEKLAVVNQVMATPDHINVTVGATGGIAAAFSALLDEGDEVLIPDPYFPNYLMALSCTPAKVVFYPLHASNGFLPDLEELGALVTPRTKLLLVNSPGNPSGVVFPQQLMEGIVAFCQAHDLYLLSDECYDQVLFDASHVSPASFCQDGRLISTFSFSKTYAMTGYRVGYVVTSPQLAKVINKVLEGNMACVTSFAQKGAEAALQGPQDGVARMVSAYRQRRDVVDGLLKQHGLWVARPEGAFYALADVSQSGLDARSFALRLLEEAKVAVAPGTAFGKNINGLIRLSLASSEGDLRDGIERIASFLNVIRYNTHHQFDTQKI